MHANLAVAAAAAAAVAPLAVSAEQVLGVYLFHRHGDRSAKVITPVHLTTLGADQVHQSGQFYRARYVDNSSDLSVTGLAPQVAVLSQLQVTAPKDAVLHNSAESFVQALYPPLGASVKEKLANGSEIAGPLDNYQFVPVDAVSDAATVDKAESNTWLQGGSGCSNAEVSSNAYFKSPEYMKQLDSTKDFYHGLMPVIKTSYDEDKANFKNAYGIFDYVNVGTIHNQSDLVSDSTYNRLFTLASDLEWNLAFNASSPVRAIAGSVLAGQILSSLTSVVDKPGTSPRFNAQFGAYGTFMSFFGLAQLPSASPDFYGVCNYASSMAFELVTNSTDAKPAADDISVRFLFSNGTAAQNDLKQFPLFGQDKLTLSWADFKDGMSKFAIEDDKHWCQLCGNSGGKCAANGTESDSGAKTSGSSGSGGSGGVSKPVAGVIGALVTLVVILGAQAAIMLFGGVRFAKKSTIAQAHANQSNAAVKG